MQALPFDLPVSFHYCPLIIISVSEQMFQMRFLPLQDRRLSTPLGARDGAAQPGNDD